MAKVCGSTTQSTTTHRNGLRYEQLLRDSRVVEHYVRVPYVCCGHVYDVDSVVVFGHPAQRRISPFQQQPNISRHVLVLFILRYQTSTDTLCSLVQTVESDHDQSNREKAKFEHCQWRRKGFCRAGQTYVLLPHAPHEIGNMVTIKLMALCVKLWTV